MFIINFLNMMLIIKSNWLINGTKLSILFIQLTRQGNYTYAGFMFFPWLYYYNAILSEK